MTSVIEDWKNRVEFKVLSSTDKEEEMTVLDFVNEHFVPREPLNCSINMCEVGYRMAWFDNFVRKLFPHDLTVLAHDRESHELLGVAIVGECKAIQDVEDDVEKKKEEHLPRWLKCPAKFGQVLQFLEVVTGSVDLFQKYQIDKYAELFILTTHSTKRCPGLGTELTLEALKTMTSKGFQYCVTEATSLYSQKIFNKIGFETLAEFKFEDFQPKGEIVFAKYDVHDNVKLMVKQV